MAADDHHQPEQREREPAVCRCVYISLIARGEAAGS